MNLDHFQKTSNQCHPLEKDKCPNLQLNPSISPKLKVTTGLSNFATKSSVKSTTLGCRSAAFEILGFDILLDRKLRPWLLEVNRSPSFGVDSKLDRRVKSNLLRDTLNLINIRPSDKKRSEEAEKAHSIRRLLFTTPTSTPKIRQTAGPLKHQAPKATLSPYPRTPASTPSQGKNNISTKKKAAPVNAINQQQRTTISSIELASDWLKNPTKLKDRIYQLKERIQEMRQESELECFENVNCGNWRRVYPTMDRNMEARYARLLTRTFLDFNKGKEGDLKQVIQISQSGGQQEDELLQQLDYLENEAKKIMSPSDEGHRLEKKRSQSSLRDESRAFSDSNNDYATTPRTASNSSSDLDDDGGDYFDTVLTRIMCSKVLCPNEVDLFGCCHRQRVHFPCNTIDIRF